MGSAKSQAAGQAQVLDSGFDAPRCTGPAPVPPAPRSGHSRSLGLISSVYDVYNGDMNSRDIVRRLEQAGWRLVRTKGRHRQYKHADRSGLVTVPHPKRDLPIGTLKSIYKQAGWEWDQ